MAYSSPNVEQIGQGRAAPPLGGVALPSRLQLIVGLVWLSTPALALVLMNIDPPLDTWRNRCFLASTLAIPAVICGLATLLGVFAVTSMRRLAIACAIVLSSALLPVPIIGLIAVPMLLIPITGPFLYLLLMGMLCVCTNAFGLLLMIHCWREELSA